MKLTIVITKGEDFYLSTIKEIPAVISQGESIDEARANVIDALQLYLEDMQNDTMENTVLEEDLMIN
jgi:predicted RNase H-like HicB family nuclease